VSVRTQLRGGVAFPFSRSVCEGGFTRHSVWAPGRKHSKDWELANEHWRYLPSGTHRGPCSPLFAFRTPRVALELDFFLVYSFQLNGQKHSPTPFRGSSSWLGSLVVDGKANHTLLLGTHGVEVTLRFLPSSTHPI
jgi:hypothetical protein